jgi:hypothetical protein
MRFMKYFLGLGIILVLLNSCNKDFSINAEWQDITVVYGLLSQNDSVHYLKITKAFLGPGNALEYSQIPDSSNYPVGEITVRIDEFDPSGQNFLRSIPFDTLTIHSKEAGDTIFYYPDQRVFVAHALLDESRIYKLMIHNNKTGKDITSETSLVQNFSIQKPDPFSPNEKSVFLPNSQSSVKWTSAAGGKRYQLLIRFHYSERPANDPGAVWVQDSVDWPVFSNELSKTTGGGEEMVKAFSGDAFYSVLANPVTGIPVNPDLVRFAGKVDYIFSTASEELNTYMNVTEPSTTVVQYKPPYTNITNGIGLFSSRLVINVNSRTLSDATLSQIKVNPKTAPLGF